MGKGLVDPFCERRCMGMSARETIIRANSACAKRANSRLAIRQGVLSSTRIGINRSEVGFTW